MLQNTLILIDRYPHDSFICKINIESGYLRVEDLILKSESIIFKNFHQMINNGSGPFHLNVTGVKDFQDMNYSQSVLQIRMSRIITPYLISTYLPSAILVFASQISFHIPPDNIPGRMSLLVTILLMFINILGNVREDTPLVSAISYLDAWCMVCIVFTSMALFEYAIIIHIRFLSTDYEDKLKARCRKLDIAASFLFISLFVAFTVIYFAVAFL